MYPKSLSVQDFTYHLPEEKIARYPLEERDGSRLLIYDNGTLTETRYKNIDQYLPPHSLLLFNNTKVVEARLLFQKTIRRSDRNFLPRATRRLPGYDNGHDTKRPG